VILIYVFKQAHNDLALKNGSVMRSGVRVASWKGLPGNAMNPTGSVEVTLSNGEKHVAGQLVLTAGAWMSQLVPELKVYPQNRSCSKAQKHRSRI
jgi:hypothetical protein